MTRFKSRFGVLGLASLMVLMSGCASSVMMGKDASEEFYDSNVIVGTMLAPVDLAVGIPLHTVTFVFTNLDSLIAINGEMRESGVY